MMMIEVMMMVEIMIIDKNDCDDDDDFM